MRHTLHERERKRVSFEMRIKAIPAAAAAFNGALRNIALCPEEYCGNLQRQLAINLVKKPHPKRLGDSFKALAAVPFLWQGGLQRRRGRCGALCISIFRYAGLASFVCVTLQMVIFTLEKK